MKKIVSAVLKFSSLIFSKAFTLKKMEVIWWWVVGEVAHFIP